MAASATVSVAGNFFSGDFRLRTRSTTSLSQIPSKPSVLFRLDADQSLHYKLFWRMGKSKSLTFCNESFALGKEAEDGFISNMNEDTDEMFDDLFKKQGKVVFKNKDQKSATAEVNDDAECLAFAVELAKVASDVKAADIKVLFVKPLVYWTRFFIIATAFSRPQIDAIGSRMRDLAETKYGKVPNGDAKPNSWTLLDFGDVVIHIFLPPQRTFYNLEEFYANATLIELPFENQPPSRSS